MISTMMTTYGNNPATKTCRVLLWHLFGITTDWLLAVVMMMVMRGLDWSSDEFRKHPLESLDSWFYPQPRPLLYQKDFANPKVFSIELEKSALGRTKGIPAFMQTVAYYTPECRLINIIIQAYNYSLVCTGLEKI